MHSYEKVSGFVLHFFPESDGKTSTVYVSTPPPLWLDGSDLSQIGIISPGVYCLFFLAASSVGGSAFITVNGRPILGSEVKEKHGEVSGSAVCSIRDHALPCKLAISTENGAGAGVLLVAKYNI